MYRFLPLEELANLPPRPPMTPEQVAQAYLDFKAQFTAADLAEFCNPIENEVDIDVVLEGMDAIFRQSEVEE